MVDGVYERLHQRVQLTRLNSQEVERRGLGMSKLALRQRGRPLDQSYTPLEAGQEAHWEVVERVLFLYAKLNPGQRYVQGMNEIVGPIYYVLATDPREEWRGELRIMEACQSYLKSHVLAAHAEADCFFCFTNLMSDIRDFFIKTLDQAETGVNTIMQR